MTNDEIIKALFACSIKGNCPADCPYQSIKDTGIDDCLASIPERDAEVLKAFYIRNIPRIEISEMFHVEHSHIYRMKAKAEERFGELYNTKGRR
ncbi:MAG: sigma-70 family RNA polymerase sigma factor [Lachnospiraceae bacterium]|nr:sigma-70 family RNA polymerase sigma factor [Lachnospiraceae bacterium]